MVGGVSGDFSQTVICRVVNIAILKVLQYYWQYFLGIASICQYFLNLVLIAVLQYFFLLKLYCNTDGNNFLEIDQF